MLGNTFFRFHLRVGINAPLSSFPPGVSPGDFKFFQQRNLPAPPQHDVAVSLLTHKGGFLYTPSHLKQVLITFTSPSAEKPG